MHTDDRQKSQVRINTMTEQIEVEKNLKSSSRSNKTLILAVLAFVVLIIAIKVINSRTQLQKISQPEQVQQKLEPIEPSPANLTKLKLQSYSLIEKAQRSSPTTFECIKMSPLPHIYKDGRIYFATDYGIFIQGCLLLENYRQSGSRQNIKKWNNDREVTEWALQRLTFDEKILYYRPNAFNIAQLTLIRNLIGPKGEIVILENNLLKTCLNTNLNLYQMNSNVKYESVGSLKTLKDFTAIIADVTLFSKLSKTLQQQIQLQSKLFIIAKNQTIQEFSKQYKIRSFSLPKEDCSKGSFSQEFFESGFYELKLKIRKSGSVLSHLQDYYSQRKADYIKRLKNKIDSLDTMEQKCLDVDSKRSYEQIYLSIYGRQLLNVSESEVSQWEGKRHAVEWMRAKIQEKNGSLDTYYEMNHHFNLVAIVEIAILVNDSTLYVVCSPVECGRIKQQIDLNRIKNVNLLTQSSLQRAANSAFLITDNETITEKSLQRNYSQNGNILAYFTHTRNSSILAIRRLYVRHNIRQVIMKQSLQECLGFEYLHYFWNIQEPEGFYQLNISTYVVYVFWGGSPKKLNIRKRLPIQQVTAFDVETKIISPETFIFFENPDYPVHPAYFLLTSTQRSDYVRFYMMHVYGGGYCDVKHVHFEWRPFFERMEKDPDHDAYGYPEKHPDDVACFDSGKGQKSCEQIRRHYAKMIGNGMYMFRRGSPVTKQWFRTATQNLDKKIQDLKKNPPQVPRQVKGGYYIRSDGTQFVSKYPFRWAEIANQHLARAQNKYLDRISTCMPYVIMADYRTNNNLDQN